MRQEQSIGIVVCGYRDTQTIPATGHTHSLTHHPAVAVTCTAEGTGEYWSCGGCNKLFSDADAQNEINAVPILDKLMHNYGDWISNGDDTHTRSCRNAGCSQSGTENCSGGTATFTEKAVCEKCGGRYGELLADTVAPKGEIRVATNRWTSFLHTITFGIFFNETKEVTITAEDQESGVAVVGYYRSAKGLEEEEVREIRGWTPGNNDTTTFQISPDERCVIYAKIIDCQGNVTYISSDGLEFDRTGPVISGISDGESYCNSQTVTVTDNSGLDTVKVNGETITLQDGKFTLQASSGRQRVTATDKAGNSTTVTVTVNDGHSFGDWISNGDGTHTRSCQNAGCSQSETEKCSGGMASFTEKAVCEKCGGRYGELLADTVVPKGEIRIATNRWTSFLHTITFGIFFNETKEVTITAEDQESGVAVVGYYISAKGLEEEEVREIRGWTPGNNDTTTFQISPDERCVIYAKIIDCQGNVTYISSNGLEFDRTGPVISGIKNGESYCSPQTVTVTDNSGLDTVKVNEETVTLQDGKFTLQASSGTQRVTVTDKAGNSTAATVTVNNGHSFGDWITDQEATENGAGTKHRVCSVCEYKDMQTIPAMGSNNRPVSNGGKPIIDTEKGNGPKTGDNAQLELYATLAMISGLSYLLLYFADRRRGMTEETKKELVSRLARWAKGGGKIRKLLALAAIFVLLVYYHSIGKKTVVEWKDIYGE